MDKTSILYETKKVIAQFTGLAEEEIDDESALIQDLGLSSLEIISMLKSLEKSFHVALSVRELRKVVTLSDLANEVLERQ